MLIIILLLLVGLCAFFVFSAEDLTNKTSQSKLAWGISIFFFAAFVGCLFIVKDELRKQAIVDYQNGKYKLEMVVNTDTTYFVKKVK
jgi:hypothetical protein